MKFSIKRNTCLTLLVASAAALTVSACGVEIRPAPQGPRYYTAAHDTVSGKCEQKSGPGVRCVTTAVTTTGEEN